MPDLSWLTQRPVAHRGLHDVSAGIVENTLPAVEAAAAAGYAVEIDVQPSADGEAMVFHDATLDRLLDATGPIATRPAAELARLRFRAGHGLGIPTLAQVLEEIGGRVPLIVEIKSDRHRDDALERRVVSLLRDYRGPVAAMSFDPRRVVAVRRLAPELPRGIVSMRYDGPDCRSLPARYRFMLRHLLHAPATRPHFVAYDVHGLPAPAPAAFRQLGIPLLSWTVRTPAEREKAERWADQIIFEGFRA